MKQVLITGSDERQRKSCCLMWFSEQSGDSRVTRQTAVLVFSYFRQHSLQVSNTDCLSFYLFPTWLLEPLLLLLLSSKNSLHLLFTKRFKFAHFLLAQPPGYSVCSRLWWISVYAQPWLNWESSCGQYHAVVTVLPGLLLAGRVICGAKSQKNSVASHLSPCSKEILLCCCKRVNIPLETAENTRPLFWPDNVPFYPHPRRAVLKRFYNLHRFRFNRTQRYSIEWPMQDSKGVLFKCQNEKFQHFLQKYCLILLSKLNSIF